MRGEQFGRKALSSPSGASKQGLSAAAVHLPILDHITTHYDEPGLSMVGAAKAHNISPRYLQRLIASTGTTFTGR